MPDRGKVINALGRCNLYGYCEDVGCPYYKSALCLELLRKDTLELLKEQETVIRCKDCKRHLECDYWIENGDDWYCANGERR